MICGQPSDAGADSKADGDGGENCQASERDGPAFVGGAAGGRSGGCHEIWRAKFRRDELRSGELARNHCGGVPALTKFNRGAANAGTLLSEPLQQFLIRVSEGGGRRGKYFENSGKSSLLVVAVASVAVAIVAVA